MNHGSLQPRDRSSRRSGRYDFDMSVLTSNTPSTSSSRRAQATTRAGVVSFLNARPLVAGLDALAGWSIQLSPPSGLIGLLEADVVDLALCSSVDLLSAPFDVAWLASTPLACRGATQTVRLFSQRDVRDIRTIHCDTDSHTSVALLRILLAEYWNGNAELVPLNDSRPVEAQLLIGDKVVQPNLTSDQWPVQEDLGEAWFAHTGLPFVFAVWMGRADRSVCIQRAGRVIDRQLRLNQHRLDAIIAKEAPSLGWACPDASKYLTSHIRYDFGEDELTGLLLFLDKCRVHGCGDDRAVPAPLTL
jgi:chorismate dehydratase